MPAAVRPKQTAHATDAPARRYVLRVDFSERHATLLELARTCVDFDVQMDRLEVGDYCIDGRVVIERKTYADFAMSLADGRLFPQAASLARSPHRPVVLLEGPRPAKMPDVHPHALKGAMISLAVMWRLPVLHARDPEDPLRVLRFVAHQLGNLDPGILAAKRRGLLEHVQPSLDSLREHRFFMEPKLYDQIVRLAGEAND